MAAGVARTGTFPWWFGGSHGEYPVPTFCLPWEPRNDHGTMIITARWGQASYEMHAERHSV